MILAPNSRLLLLDAIKPPPGFEVDAAVGTTYTLGLDALLIPPASWAAHAASDRVDDVDPILLANTLRLFADRTLVFHQAGFASPFAVGYEALAAFLDGMIYPVVVPDGSTFHPKVWVLRFHSETGEVGLRVLVGSRNLSLETTWDVLVRLDSSPDDTANISGAPLAELLGSLPERSTVTIPAPKRALLDSLILDLNTTRFAAPPGATDAEIIYWQRPGTPMGIFPASCDNRLVISPFLGSDGLGLLPRVRESGRSVLVSRPGSLSTELAAGFDPYTLQTDATDVDDGEEARLGSELHAKVYAFDDGDTATIIIGSANATWGAFALNDEVVVRLHGDVADFGVLQILGKDSDESDSDDADVDLGMLLEPWLDTGEAGDDETDGRFFEPAIRSIASTRIDGACDQLEGDRYRLTLTAHEPMIPPPGISIEFALLGQADPLPPTFSDGLPAVLEMDLGDITRLVQVRLSDASGEIDAVTMVLLADFDPPDRRHIRALRSLLTDRDRFLRFLRYLLDTSRSELPDGGGDGSAVRSQRRSSRRLPIGGDGPILEPLLRLLAQDPAELRHLQAVIAEFADDVTILPKDFQSIWQAISPLIPQADAKEADHDLVG